MTTVKVAPAIRWPLLAVLVLTVGMTGCRSDEAARGLDPEPMTAAQVQEVLAHEGPSGDGRFPGGTFTFGSPFDNSDSPFGDPEKGIGGRLASASWDVYWYRNDGDRGAWGAGIDVLRTPGRAARALDDEAAFWCPGSRRGVEELGNGGVADVRASTCRRAGGEGFYATLDAADGSVLTSLTVGGPTRPAAVAALRAVWPAIRDAVVRVRASLG
ncbi:MAG: hypothetical protein ACRDOZ_12055 [Nocardioides sp.]